VKKSGLVLALAAACGLPAANPAIPPVAQKFLTMFHTLRVAQALPAATRPRLSFALSDGEINDYLRYSLRAIPRPGLDSVTIKIFPHNYVSTYTIIDFDAVERWRPGTIPFLLRVFLQGKQTIWVDYRFGAANSRISFEVEKAYYDQIRLPAFLVQKVIEILAARQPEHYDTSRPLPLPFGLRDVWTEDKIVKGNN
jgi:hypothetical protein